MEYNIRIEYIFVLIITQWIETSLSRGTIYDLKQPYLPFFHWNLEGFEEWQKDARPKIYGLTVGFQNSTAISM